MIHQFIFASPKPGLSSEAFASYWLSFHAVEFASKIIQIKRYLIALPLGLDSGRDVPDFDGVAEIWLKPEEQIISLQSPEFLNGARADEPRWAAFWLTLALDTDPSILVGEADPPPGSAYAKLYRLVKRRPATPLSQFRESFLAERQECFRPAGLARHLVCLCRDGLYGLGEPRFDAVEVMGFTDAEALAAALDGGLREELRTGLPFVHSDYRFGFTAQEHWVIRPGER